MTTNMNDLVTHLKETGFVFPGSEIYGGLANSWDYGPLGVAVKNNLKRLWWKKFIDQNPLNVGLDSSIILNPKVWVASGHVQNFNDPLIECKNCHHRFRSDHLIKNHLPKMDLSNKSPHELEKIIDSQQVVCTNCQAQNFSEIQQFDLMFKTKIGPVVDSENDVYLRPETAQGIFVNFKTVQRVMRKALPFGIGQIGKSFRNEITPGNFIFRTREFEQMELEFFYHPSDKTDWFNYWLDQVDCFLRDQLQLQSQNYRLHQAPAKELGHYATKTLDFEYRFPFGWEELWGLSDRGSYDLNTHQKHSGRSLTLIDAQTREGFFPHVIEPSVGVERLMLALFCEGFVTEKLSDTKSRIVMKLPAALAPYQLAVLPLQKNQNEMSWSIYTNLLRDGFIATYDEKGAIGKRYRRQDAIGTPLVVTVDFDSQTLNTVTVRDRDSMLQETVAIIDLPKYLSERLD